MKAQSHLSDAVLRKVISDEHFDTKADDVETHIDSCTMCRERMELLAADQSWLAPYRETLSNDFHSVPSSISKPELKQARSASRDFDRRMIDGMLSELLAPSIHPENIGQLGNYEVESVIGYGGMGVVLRAYDRSLQRPVAIKLVAPRLANDGTAKQRFAREARAAATVLHPNVIAIHCIDETDGVPWFAMPLVAGPTLSELVAEKGPLREQDIVRIGLQIASGLAAAHSHGLVHRDIKPANILVDNHVNRVVLTDFGLVRHDSDTLITQTGVLAGTPHYMSPEQTRGEDLDGRSDLFSLGSVLYFLATGSVPFDADTPLGILHKIANTPHRDARWLNPEISKTLSSAIDMLLSKDCSDRFQSASEVEQFFAGLVAHLNQPTQHSIPVVPVRKKSRWNAALLGVIPVVLAAIGFSWWYGSLPSSATEPTPEKLWSAIQAQYQLEPPQEFDNKFSQVVSAFNQLDKQLSEPTPQEGVKFKEQLSEFEKRLRYLAKGIE